MAEFKTAMQLEEMIADQAGLDTKNVQVSKVGNGGDFHATMIGSVGGVSRSRAQSDIDAVCTNIKAKFKLKT